MLSKIKNTLFPDTSSTGIIADGETLRSVTLRKSGKRVQVVGIDTQCGINISLVADGPKVRSMVVETPVMKDADLGAWLEDNQSKFFPATLEFSEYVNDWQVIGRDGDTQQVLLGSAWQDRIDAVLDKQIPETLGCRGLDLFNPFALWQEGFLQGNKAVVEVNSLLARVLLVRDGAVASEHELPVADGVAAEIEQILVDFWEKEELQNPVDTVYLCGSGNLDAVRNGFRTVVCPVHTASFNVDGTQVGPAHVHALGLALKRYYPVLNSLNMLTAEAKEHNRQEREKGRAFTFGAWHAAVFTGLAVLILPLYFWSAAAVTSTGTQVRARQAEIAVMERLVARNRRLTRNAADLYALLTERTNTARVLDELNATVEKDLWFRHLEIRTEDSGKKTVELEGYALNPSQISAFLGNLEQAPGIGNARLEMTEKLDAKKVYRLSGRRRRREVFSFKITAQLLATETQRHRGKQT